MVRRDKWIDPERVNEIILMLNQLSKEQGFHFALVGGVALQYLGSDRFTKDVDVVADAALDAEGKLTVIGPINFGGTAYQTPSGGKLDYILRDDEFQKLYEKALEEAVVTEHGFPMVTPDYLAAMKFVAHITDRRGSVNHLSDLKWLLRQEEGFVDPKKIEAIVYRYAGGRLPQEMFRKISDEVRFERSEER
jgi:hypothetical protein